MYTAEKLQMPETMTTTYGDGMEIKKTVENKVVTGFKPSQISNIPALYGTAENTVALTEVSCKDLNAPLLSMRPISGKNPKADDINISRISLEAIFLKKDSFLKPASSSSRQNGKMLSKPAKSKNGQELYLENAKSYTDTFKKNISHNQRAKRKTIDITKSSTYKEIYAQNLRLHSNVLAKQMANTNQVGRELNYLRRFRMKEKALCLPRSNSFHVFQKQENKTLTNDTCNNNLNDFSNKILQRSKSEGAQMLQSSQKRVETNFTVVNTSACLKRSRIKECRKQPKDKHNKDSHIFFASVIRPLEEIEQYLEKSSGCHCLSEIEKCSNQSKISPCDTIDIPFFNITKSRNNNDACGEDEDVDDGNGEGACTDCESFNYCDIEDEEEDEVLEYPLQSLKSSSNQKQRLSPDYHRKRSASERVEFIRKRIISFDNTVEKMNSLITKVKLRKQS